MTRRNRVLPDGTIHAIPARGTMTGNRGILHVADGQMGPALWKHRAWICCTLDWQGRKRRVMSGRKWTELFFLDEAVAMAAGHRPCAYCRRAAFDRFKTAWEKAHGPWPGVGLVDARLHRERALPGARALRTHRALVADLPVGAIYALDGAAWVVRHGGVQRFTPEGWGTITVPPKGSVDVHTPPALLAVLRNGYVPMLHPSAK